MNAAHEVWFLVNAGKAHLWEIQAHWTLDNVFDACDALSHYGDMATYQRPRPRPQPPRRPGPFG